MWITVNSPGLATRALGRPSKACLSIAVEGEELSFADWKGTENTYTTNAKFVMGITSLGNAAGMFLQWARRPASPKTPAVPITPQPNGGFHV
jgi:hypothetical protein